MDIYDGDKEPMVYHGKTLTSKVSLRDICQAIAKYSFITSPYPVLISAEVHCGIAQQDKLVDIMVETFGDAIVQAPVEDRPKIEALPSPEDLKHKFLLKVCVCLTNHPVFCLTKELGEEPLRCCTSSGCPSRSPCAENHSREGRRA